MSIISALQDLQNLELIYTLLRALTTYSLEAIIEKLQSNSNNILKQGVRKSLLVMMLKSSLGQAMNQLPQNNNESQSYFDDAQDVASFAVQTIEQLVDPCLSLVLSFSNISGIKLTRYSCIGIVPLPIALWLYFHAQTALRRAKLGTRKQKNAGKAMISGIMKRVKSIKVHQAEVFELSMLHDVLNEQADQSNKKDDVKRLKQTIKKFSSMFRRVGVCMSLLTKFSGREDADKLFQFTSLVYERSFQLVEYFGTLAEQWDTIANTRRILALPQEELTSFNSCIRLLRAVEGKDTTKPSPSARSVSLEYKNVTFSYDSNRVIQFSHLFETGHCYALTGQSGCGKSTMAAIAARLQTCTSGKVFIDGVDTNSIPLSDLRQKVVICLQDDAVVAEWTLAQNIKYGAQCNDEWARAMAGIDFRSCQEIVGELSGGQKQRVALARALSEQAEVIILDEATSGLDSQCEHEVISKIVKWIRQSGKILIVITHNSQIFEYFDEVVKM